MKKVILFAAILFAGVSVVNAQSTTPKTNVLDGAHTGSSDNDATTLTVELNSVQAISVNTSNVTLSYLTVNDYKNGVKSGPISSHLNVFSTGDFNVYVDYENVSDDGNGNDADSDAIFNAVSVEVSSSTANGSIASAPLVKKTTEGLGSLVVASTLGGVENLYDVQYVGGGVTDASTSGYMNFVKKGAKRTFVATVTYSVTAN